MDAPTAALIGAALGFGGALFAAWLNPFSTARHAREAKNVELRRDAYVKGLNASQAMRKYKDPSDHKRALHTAMDAWSEMLLVASPSVAELYGEVYTVGAFIQDALVASPSEQAPLKLRSAFTEALGAFLDAARADIGADVPYYDK